MRPNLSYYDTINGIHYTAWHADTATIDLLNLSISNVICMCCKMNFRNEGRDCETCKKVSKVTHSKGDHDIDIRFQKPWKDD